MAIHRFSQTGFSLLETMVALTILSISIAGASGMFTVAEQGIAGGSKSLTLTALAETKMERLRAIPFHMLVSPDLKGKGIIEVRLEDSGKYSVREEFEGMVASWSIYPDLPDLTLSPAVTIMVVAEDRRGRQKSITLGMRRANPYYMGESK